MTTTLQSELFAAPTTRIAPRPYQIAARDAACERLAAERSTLIVLPTGCHRAGQLVLMADGSLRVVESVSVGDDLMGPDGTPRRVMSLTRASGEMAEVRPVKGEPWVVDMDHVLTLVRTSTGGPCPSEQGGVIVDVTVRDWMAWARSRKHIHKLFRAAVNFPDRPRPTIDPYALGVCIGDGSLSHSVVVTTPDREIWDAVRPTADAFGLRFVELTPADRCAGFRLSGEKGERNPLLDEIGRLGLRVTSEHKFIPDDYKLGERSVRLGVLAGLIDTDAHLTCGGYDFISKSRRLSDDAAFVARSLGLAAYVTEKICHDQHGTGGLYYRVSISGDCSIVPCRVPRKVAAPRRQKKDPLRTGLTVEATGTVEPFFGFTLDGDQRYLLGDFTVTHNCGKTAVAGMLAERVKEAAGRTLFLAPTITLVEQTYKALRTAGFDLTSGVEQAENYVPRPLPDVTVGSVATMRGERLRRFDRSSYALVIVDEAHRAPGGTAYREILSHFADAKVVGLSATPDRADGLAMGNVFESVAYEMSMLAAIDGGWLCPLEFRTVKTGWDPKQIKEVGGMVDVGSVEKELVRSGLLNDAASTLAELGKGRKVLAFLPTVASAKAFAVELTARDLTSAHIDGETPPMMRQTIFRDFRAGKLDVLTNCMVLTEGFDEPSVSVVALLAPTKSRGRLTQMIGRGTRTAPGKENCLILDFCPGRLKKGRLAAPADALAGKMLDDDVYQAMSDGGDLRVALADAQASAEETREAMRQRREERERLALERRKRLDGLLAETKRRNFEYAQRYHDAKALLGDGRHDAASDGAPVQRNNVAAPEDEETRRRRLGLCSPRQSALLRRYGLNPDMRRGLAGEAISAIEKNKWKIPDNIRNDRRFAAPAKALRETP